MRSTFAGLNTMYRGINTSQLSLDTVGHNITNANTEGYSRQRVNLVTTRSQTIYGFYGGSQVGSGVDASSITRARDVFADKQYWRESSNTEYASAKQQTFDKIEAIFDDSDDSGIQNAMNEFWQSWKSLSTNASDYSARVVVRDKGKSLSDKIQQGTSQLQDLIEDNNSKLELKINTVNQLTKQIAELNDEIFTTENVGGTANDLRDSRDLMVDKLSALVNVSVYEKGNGTYSISSDGNLLVDGSSHTDLATVSTPNKKYGTRDVKVVFQKTGATFDIQNGELRGIQDSVKESKSYIDDMARMSAYLLTDFNAQHQSGYGMNDESGVNFFGKDGTINADNGGSILYQYDADSKTVKVTDKTTGRITGTLNSIQMIQELNVNARFDVTDSATGSKGTDLIAAKAKSSTDPNKEDAASGNNALLLGEAINVTNSKMLGNVPLSGYYTGMMGSLGVDAQTIDRTMTNQENIMLQTDNWRGSISGVNWNEELTNMIKFQQGYSSCSRCLTTMDEMLDKLINSTGVVGR